jgi:hypothetical protein
LGTAARKPSFEVGGGGGMSTKGWDLWQWGDRLAVLVWSGGLFIAAVALPT